MPVLQGQQHAHYRLKLLGRVVFLVFFHSGVLQIVVQENLRQRCFGDLEGLTRTEARTTTPEALKGFIKNDDYLPILVIRFHPRALDIYMTRLIEEKHLSQEKVSSLHNNIFKILNEELNSSKDYVPSTRDWLVAYWAVFKGPEQLSRIQNTSVKPEILKNVGQAMTTLSQGFIAHKGIQRVYVVHRRIIETREDVDWPTAESLVFATLLK